MTSHSTQTVPVWSAMILTPRTGHLWQKWRKPGPGWCWSLSITTSMHLVAGPDITTSTLTCQKGEKCGIDLSYIYVSPLGGRERVYVGFLLGDGMCLHQCQHLL